MHDTLTLGCKSLGIVLTRHQELQLDQFYQLLISWNKKMNLTAITDYEEVVMKHFLDSLNVLKAYDLDTGKSVVDIGAGAGFPGIPLAIVFPQNQFTLMDALNKRVQFMNTVSQSLGLSHVQAVHGRAEDLARASNYREQFDLCFSRAVSHLAILSEYCLPFVRSSGTFIAYKSIDTDDEIQQSQAAITILGGELSWVLDYPLAHTDTMRRYIGIKKIAPTPDGYPRRAGIPTKKPISK